MIKVGAATEVELKEKKHRIEDAVSSVRAAIEEGVVAGGGTALIRARTRGPDASSTRSRATSRPAPGWCGSRSPSPARNIAENAGLEGNVMVRAIEAETGTNGLNAATGEIVDLVKAGIIDPAKVTRAALQNAASIAALVITTECLIADKPEPPSAPMGGGMDGMGGMGGMM